ncbi:S8 family peptidase [Streptoalloteichus hindustanus]|uniref:Serine protease, subtilisin family n=1 Tax=Streptoalloteichus hindustanus TaxID=2017 RepID=A0A1M5FQW2_STRHI|nr:S8 family serine peptidase [Streptoalloteichus hindustanus]SHF93552.1 Serine protease, subtilisin family [Streptoalloteichus hindustanus]
MTRQSRLWATVLALAAATSTVVAGAGPAGAAGPAPAGPAGSVAGATTHKITLVTGDVVRAQDDGRGGWTFGVEPAEFGSPVGYAQFTRKQGDRTDWYVIPNSAEPLVASGVIDQELFNITGLIRQEYDDARSDTVPLLVEYAEDRAAADAVLPEPAKRAAKVERTLPSARFAAVAEAKENAGDFFRGLTGNRAEKRSEKRSEATTLTGGPRKIWLNARFRASLDASAAQVGAPTAWKSGLTGKDVTVAVLDSGYDTAHPDLAGKVAVARDFTGTTVRDGRGHGTHVASIIAGSGAASGGKYRGVAPDARLAIGKVLDDQGRGQLDDILAAMEWAAGEAKAKVVTMSLGAYPTDGTDPASRMVNTLTEKYGALFVVAAGNDGMARGVTTPATADAALAVGSVDKSDQLSPFSNRGPRLGDNAVKPEIAAPGSDIVAARAAGTQVGEPVGESYTRLSGTSMASPHVAGAAAILAQQHPDWRADGLKAALVGSANPVARRGVSEVGAGRLDVARATSQPIRSTTSSVNAFLTWPERDAQRREITYHNSGSAPVTVDLDLKLADDKGQAPSERLAKLSAKTVTVPAGGTAKVTLTLTPRSGKPGLYGGVLTASTADGTTRVRTPISVHDETESHDVTVKLLDHDGKVPGRADVLAFNVDTGETTKWSGETMRLPAGRYNIIAVFPSPSAGGRLVQNMMAHPGFRLSRDSTVTFDARKAKKVSVTTDQPAARGGGHVVQLMSQNEKARSGWIFSDDPRFVEVYVYSPPGASEPSFSYASAARLEDPEVELYAEKPRRFEAYSWWARNSARLEGTQRWPMVHAGHGLPADLSRVDVRDKLVVLDLPGDTGFEELSRRVNDIKTRGGRAVALTNQQESAGPQGQSLALPTLEVSHTSGPLFSEAAKAGGAEASLTARGSSKYRYELVNPEAGRVPNNPAHQARTADLAAVTMAYHGGTAEKPPVSDAYFEGLGTLLGTFQTRRAVPHAERVEYFSPGTWRIGVSADYGPPDIVSTLRHRERLERGKPARISWNASVVGPALSGTTGGELGGEEHPWVWLRDREALDVTVPLLSDAAGHVRSADPDADKGSTSLSVEGQVVGVQNRPGRAVFPLSDRQARGQVRLATEMTRDQPWWRTSTKVSAAWVFTPNRAPGAPMPLLTVRYAPSVDLHNRTQGDREFTFPVTVSRQDGPTDIRAFELEVSYDDGTTWRPAAVARDGDAWKATVKHPASGFASLRAKAADMAGNTVEQTIIRAYQIGG